MKQNQIHPAPGSKKDRKIVGRGDGSGHGNYCGRGRGGQKARTSVQMRPGFEGGQLPLIKRLPARRGFFNRFRVAYIGVNLGRLNSFEAGSEVNPEILVSKGIIKKGNPVKILAGGEIDRALNIKANKFSAAAKAKIEAAGGKAEEIS